MIRLITGALRRWEKDAGVKAVIFRGAEGRAFCAGGDLKSFRRAGMDFRKGKVSPAVPAVFFAEEYALNRLIFHYPKPTIAHMDGVTMGGGFGIGGNCRYRAVSERTVFAMPEVGIGFFPDVGSAYHLVRAPRHYGRYLGLTGVSVKGEDMIEAKLAEYYIRHENGDNILFALAGEDVEPRAIDRVLRGFAVAPPPSALKAQADRIDDVFRLGNVFSILMTLQKDASEWSRETLDILRRRAPASVLVAAAHLAQAEGQPFDEVIRRDFILAQRFLQRRDLYEGIRAALVDRDNAPKWDPRGFDEMTEADVDAYFQPTGLAMENEGMALA